MKQFSLLLVLLSISFSGLAADTLTQLPASCLQRNDMHTGSGGVSLTIGWHPNSNTPPMSLFISKLSEKSDIALVLKDILVNNLSYFMPFTSNEMHYFWWDTGNLYSNSRIGVRKIVSNPLFNQHWFLGVFGGYQSHLSHAGIEFGGTRFGQLTGNFYRLEKSSAFMDYEGLSISWTKPWDKALKGSLLFYYSQPISENETSDFKPTKRVSVAGQYAWSSSLSIQIEYILFGQCHSDRLSLRFRYGTCDDNLSSDIFQGRLKRPPEIYIPSYRSQSSSSQTYEKEGISPEKAFSQPVNRTQPDQKAQQLPGKNSGINVPTIPCKDSSSTEKKTPQTPYKASPDKEYSINGTRERIQVYCETDDEDNEGNDVPIKPPSANRSRSTRRKSSLSRPRRVHTKNNRFNEERPDQSNEEFYGTPLGPSQTHEPFALITNGPFLHTSSLSFHNNPGQHATPVNSAYMHSSGSAAYGEYGSSFATHTQQSSPTHESYCYEPQTNNNTAHYVQDRPGYSFETVRDPRSAYSAPGSHVPVNKGNKRNVINSLPVQRQFDLNNKSKEITPTPNRPIESQSIFVDDEQRGRFDEWKWQKNNKGEYSWKLFNACDYKIPNPNSPQQGQIIHVPNHLNKHNLATWVYFQNRWINVKKFCKKPYEEEFFEIFCDKPL